MSSNRKVRGGRRTHLALIACAVLPMVVAVSITSMLVRNQRETTRISRRFMAEAEHYDRLLVAFRFLSRQPSDALTADSPEAAAGALATANSAFRSVAADARQEILQNVAEGRRQQALNLLDQVEAAADDVTLNGEEVLAALDRGDVQAATTLLGRTNAASHSSMMAIIELRRGVRNAQVDSLDATAATYERIGAYERALLAFSVLAVVAITFYWRRWWMEQIEERERTRAMEELQLRNFAFEQAMDGVATFDLARRLTWANSSFARIIGYEPAELPGIDIRSVLDDGDASSAREMAEELRAEGRSERVLRVKRKNGSLAHVHAVLVLLDERAAGFIFIKDVTKQQQSESALRLAEERFGMAMLATRDLFADWDILENRTWINDAIHTEFGYPDDWENSIDGWIDAVHPDDREAMLQRVNDAFAQRFDNWTSEYRLRRYDGSYAYVVDRSYLVRNEDGLPVRLVSALTDMSARRHAEEELERLSAQNKLILSAAADGIFGIDRAGRTTFVNPAAVEILGWNIDDLCRGRLHDIVHSGGHSSTCWSECAVNDALTDGRTSRGSAVYMRKDGRPVNVEFTSVPMYESSGAIVGAVVTFRDVTQRLAVERAKEEFVSIVSHELRTPLTSIRGALGLITGGRAGEVPTKIGRMLEIAVTNTDRLIRLINDILDLERVDSGKVALSRALCDVSELTHHAIETMKPLADQTGVRLVEVSAAGALFADRDRVLQTLTNLIGNAIKFSGRGTAVTVSAAVDVNDVRFSVSDQGRGIPQDKLETIFERFQQVDASDSRQKGGSGLGLAICRSIVHQHGGEIRAESVEGEGSTFVFTLPRVRLDAAAGEAPRHKTLLVCEDDERIRAIEVELLECAGYRVYGFSSGQELLDAPQLASADAIVLDVGLPDRSGSEIAAMLMTRGDTRHVPVIMVSGLPRAVVSSNVVAWLMKPLSVDDLLAGVESALESSRPRPAVLLVEDDLDLARVVIGSLDRLGAGYRHAVTGREAIEMSRAFTPDLIVLDLSLPEVDGFGVVDYFKDHGLMGNVPLVVYSSNEPTPSERDRLRLGPTLFLTKSRVTPEQFEEQMSLLLESAASARELSHVA